MNKENTSECKITEVGKARSGHRRYWCSVHQATATGRYGTKLEECEGAYLEPAPDDAYCIPIGGKYQGGVALWGAVEPVYDTTNFPSVIGVHVHARESEESGKAIDESFPSVIVRCPRDMLDEINISVNSNIAVNYFISRAFNIRIDSLFCTYCGTLHLDSDYFAVNIHKKHLCHACGKEFLSDHKSISNPVPHIREKLKVPIIENMIEADEDLIISQADYLGGIRLWASNPAILWTADRPEHKGIHVHAYINDNGDKALDETYKNVVVDGVKIDEEQLRFLMAQNALPFLKEKVQFLKCPKCLSPHFDIGEKAYTPHKNHECEFCGTSFISTGRLKNTIGNPLINTLKELRDSKKEAS